LRDTSNGIMVGVQAARDIHSNGRRFGGQPFW